MIVAVTGATGFVGSHVVPALLDAGHEVRALVRRDVDLPGVSVVQGVLNAPPPEFLRGADTLLHMAGVVKARTAAAYNAVNVEATRALANAAQAAGVRQIILLSSMAAREPHLSDYARSKFEGEKVVRESFSGALSIIRAPAVFGPGDWATKPLFDLMQRGILPVLGNREHRLAMVFAPDLARAIVSQIGAPDTSSAALLEPATLNLDWGELAHYAGQALGQPVRAMKLPAWILKPIAAATSASIALGGPGHLGLGKLREFRHPDWTSGDIIDNATPIIEALRQTARSYGWVPRAD